MDHFAIQMKQDFGIFVASYRNVEFPFTIHPVESVVASSIKIDGARGSFNIAQTDILPIEAPNLVVILF